MGGGVLDRHQDGAAPLTSHGDALDQAQEYQQQRCEEADLFVGGQQSHGEGGHAHHQQGRDQCGLAAEAVTEVTEEDASQRTGEEPDGEGRERGHQADHRVRVGGEEQTSEDQPRSCGVDVEIEPFDGGPHEGCEGRTHGMR
ncbi:hypothetical protein GCM10007147_40990 [Nocardiopsis kunsanensis]|uniref:Uncharacterized protein n=1 Tax=Nocardiopsis kunsanensis TaxID=141693 RepID=A0A918XKD6_9ACTN|nr:hypothetical protein GCM10007147_40990 [Nocardiopsis kunsanensis]